MLGMSHNGDQFDSAIKMEFCYFTQIAGLDIDHFQTFSGR